MAGKSDWWCFDQIYGDLYRLKGRVGLALLFRTALLSRNFRVIATLRLCQWLASGTALCRLLLPIARLMHKVSTHVACMDFPWKTHVGPGLAITHGWGLVVSPGVRIGRNVTLFHGVTLGRSDRIDSSGNRVSGFPVIEDDVWIGPHAVIVGAVTVGCGSRIGANSLVYDDVDSHCLIVGNPAVVKVRNCAPDVMNRFNGADS